MSRLDLWLLYIFLDKDHKMYTWSCFHPSHLGEGLMSLGVMQHVNKVVHLGLMTICSAIGFTFNNHSIIKKIVANLV
jgi:hypothetical protein